MDSKNWQETQQISEWAMMKSKSQQFRKIIWVLIFAIAMAYVESAVVVYLRRVFGITNYTFGIPPFDITISVIETGREIATLAMIMTVGWAVGKSFQDRLGFASLIFGIWDIFYYFWLWIFVKWPSSLFDIDLLFLLPLPWWGPVAAPVMIALLMIICGILAIVYKEKYQKLRLSMSWLSIAILSLTILLYSFMRDALAMLPAKLEELSQIQPSPFKWGIYLIGYLMLCVVLFNLFRNVDHIKPENN